MKKLLLAFSLVFIGSQAHAASSPPYSVLVPSAPSTAVTCTASASFTLSGNVFTYTGSAPLPAGSLVCTPVVTPSTWSGSLTLTGAQASSFVLTTASPPTVNVGATALPAGSYVFGPVVATP